jgi:histone H3/H4
VPDILVYGWEFFSRSVDKDNFEIANASRQKKFAKQKTRPHFIATSAKTKTSPASQPASLKNSTMSTQKQISAEKEAEQQPKRVGMSEYLNIQHGLEAEEEKEREEEQEHEEEHEEEQEQEHEEEQEQEHDEEMVDEDAAQREREEKQQRRPTVARKALPVKPIIVGDDKSKKKGKASSKKQQQQEEDQEGKKKGKKKGESKNPYKKASDAAKSEVPVFKAAPTTRYLKSLLKLARHESAVMFANLKSEGEVAAKDVTVPATRLSASVVDMIRAFMDHELKMLLQKANEIAINSGRFTVYGRDVDLALRVMGEDTRKVLGMQDVSESMDSTPLRADFPYAKIDKVFTRGNAEEDGARIYRNSVAAWETKSGDFFQQHVGTTVFAHVEKTEAAKEESHKKQQRAKANEASKLRRAAKAEEKKKAEAAEAEPSDAAAKKSGVKKPTGKMLSKIGAASAQKAPLAASRKAGKA